MAGMIQREEQRGVRLPSGYAMRKRGKLHPATFPTQIHPGSGDFTAVTVSINPWVAPRFHLALRKEDKK